jgi:hypothetical protein
MKAEFLVPPIRLVPLEEEHANRRAWLQLRAHETDEESMAWLRRERPDLVQAEEGVLRL